MIYQQIEMLFLPCSSNFDQLVALKTYYFDVLDVPYLSLRIAWICLTFG